MDDLNNETNIENVPSETLIFASSEISEIDLNGKINQCNSDIKNGRLTNSEKKYLRYQKK